jgi:hypothetical protein
VDALPRRSNAVCSQGQTLQITSPADGTVVNPGQVAPVTVGTSNANFDMVIVVANSPIPDSEVSTAPPYKFSIQIPSNSHMPRTVNSLHLGFG